MLYRSRVSPQIADTSRKWLSKRVFKKLHKRSFCSELKSSTFVFLKNENILRNIFERKTLCPDTSRKTNEIIFGQQYFLKFIFIFQKTKFELLSS